MAEVHRMFEDASDTDDALVLDRDVEPATIRTKKACGVHPAVRFTLAFNSTVLPRLHAGS
jgi:hypothetical protein